MILVVDDEHALADTLALILERAGYKSTAAYSASEALMEVEKQRPDLIISDVMMPVMNGVDFAVKVSELRLGIKVLLISGHAGTQDMVEAAGSDGLSLDLLAKPVLPEDLLARVADILDSNYSV
jgi:two-component system alkaline phosphatase synthesis response regulator PhoP